MPRIVGQGSPLRDALLAGEACFGYFLMLDGAATARTIARVPGLKYVMIDGQHGQLDGSDIRTAIHAICAWNVSPMVRVPSFSRHLIERALDAGAHGIVVPVIPDAETARAVVAACRFPPTGNRAIGSPFCKDAFNYSTDNEYLDHANDDILVGCMIETKEGLSNYKDIVDTPGVDIIFVGGSDFALSMGFPLDREGPYPAELTELVRMVQTYALSKGKQCAAMARDAVAAAMLINRGVKLVTLGVDQWSLSQVIGKQVREAKTAIESAKGNAL